MRSGAIPIKALSAIADRFGHVLLDQWGTLHEGGAVFPAARDCVQRLRDAGKHVLVLSNSGTRDATMKIGWKHSACRRPPMTAF
ncbi:hypothetical protein [Bradyrhizobium sp. USDA 4486]